MSDNKFIIGVASVAGIAGVSVRTLYLHNELIDWWNAGIMILWAILAALIVMLFLSGRDVIAEGIRAQDAWKPRIEGSRPPPKPSSVRIYSIVTVLMVLCGAMGWLVIYAGPRKTEYGETVKTEPIAVTIGPVLANAMFYSSVDVGHGRCLQATPQFYWIGVHNNLDRFVGVGHLTIETKLKGEQAWKLARIAIPDDNVFAFLPDFSKPSRPPPFRYEHVTFISLMERLRSDLRPGEETIGWVMSEPLGPFPNLSNLYIRSYEVRMSVCLFRTIPEDRTLLRSTSRNRRGGRFLA